MKSYLTSLLILVSTFLIGQDYLPFPTDDVVWSNALYTVEEFEDGAGYYFKLDNITHYCGSGEDTIIGTQTYSIIETCGIGYKGALRDEEGVVYYVPEDSETEYLLYDFTVSVGDTLNDLYFDFEPPGGTGEVIVHSVSEVEVDGIVRRVIGFNTSFKWIEGIGCEKGFLADFYAEASEYGHGLYCMSADDTTRYIENEGVVNVEGVCSLTAGNMKYDDLIEFSVYPNPAKDIVNCIFGENIQVSEAFVTGVDGKIVSVSWSKQESGLVFSINDLPNGLYNITLITNEGVLKSSLVVGN